MAWLDDLVATRDQVAVNLRAITANPKPSYNKDGQQVSWKELFDSYTSQLKALNEQIAVASGPWDENAELVG